MAFYILKVDLDAYTVQIVPAPASFLMRPKVTSKMKKFFEGAKVELSGERENEQIFNAIGDEDNYFAVSKVLWEICFEECA